MHISVGHALPFDLICDIEHYSQYRESNCNAIPDKLAVVPTSKIATKQRTYDQNNVGDIYNNDNKISTNNDINNNNNNGNAQIKSVLVDLNSIDNNNNIDINIVTNNNIPLKSHDELKKTYSTDDDTSVQYYDDNNIENDCRKSSFIREIPKSPHLSKDFSPNGERIRDSVRARRQQRMLKNRESLRKTCEITANYEDTKLKQSVTTTTVATLNEVKDNLELEYKIQLENDLKQFSKNNNNNRKIRPYGEKGFIININKDGPLTLNNVKDLENCSDFDSSCDTSLNYIEINLPTLVPQLQQPSISTLPEYKNEQDILTYPLSQQQQQREHQNDDSLKNNKNNNQIIMPSTKSYKIALEDLKLKLNLTKNKFDSVIDNVNNNTRNDSKNSMKNYFQISNLSIDNENKLIEKEKETNINDCTNKNEMIRRISPPIQQQLTKTTTTINNITNHNKINNSSTNNDNKAFKPKLYRVNDTPIFERRNVKSLINSTIFKRIDADDKIQQNKIKTTPTIATTSIGTQSQKSQSLNTSYSSKSKNSIKKPSLQIPEIFTYKKQLEQNELINEQKYPILSKKKINQLMIVQSKKSMGLLSPIRDNNKLQHIPSSTEINPRNKLQTMHSKVNVLTPENIYKLNAKLTENKRNTSSGGHYTYQQQQQQRNGNVSGTVATGNYKNNFSGAYSRNATDNNYKAHHKINNNSISSGGRTSVQVRRNVNKFDKTTINNCGLESTAL